MTPDAWLDGARAAHARLLPTLDGLDDAAARAPSRLPGWSRGHVVTHLARNADSNTGIFLAAQAGDIGVQYPGGAEQRSTDIEAGAGRPAAALVADVRAACARLEAAWAGTSDAQWTSGSGVGFGTPRSLPDWVLSRWREVEVHHADLGLSFGVPDWSPSWVDEDLRRATASLGEPLPAGVAALGPNDRLAWFAGRLRRRDLPEAPPWP